MGAVNEAVLRLNTGYLIPKLGLGTWLATGEDVYNAVLHALRTGYRHIDTAYVYRNEAEVGKAIKEFLKENVSVKREDIFVTTKVWNTFHSANSVRRNFAMSMSNLQLDYVDLYLMHWPMGYKEGTGDDVFVPKDADGKPQYSDVPFTETYAAMEELLSEGRIRSIGVSNFNLRQLKRLLAVCKVKPAALQIEMHPYRQETELVEFCKNQDIVLEAYAPIGAPNRPSAKQSDPSLLSNAIVKCIADELNTTPASVLIAWCMARNIVCLVKSVNQQRIEENFEAQKLRLSQEMMKRINSLGDKVSFKYYLHRDGAGHPEYPLT